jgi:hypothetical protein
MGKRTLIWVLIAAGVGLAIFIGLIAGCNDNGNEQERAVSGLCSSLSDLESSTQSLTSLDPSASKDDYQSAVDEVQGDWDDVQSNLQDVESATKSELESDWDAFQSAVQNVPDDASVGDALQDIGQSAQTLASSVQSTLGAVSC